MNGISQSAASQLVSQLEEYLGARLVDRTTRPLISTGAGKAFYEGCRDLLERYYALEAEVRQRQAEKEGRLEVASIYSIVLHDMDSRLRRFVQRQPQGSVHFVYLHPSEVQRRVVAGEADLGLMSFPEASEELRAITWRIEPMVLVCAPRHPFSSNVPITCAELNGVDFVAFDDDLPIRREIDSFLQGHGVKVNIVSTFDNIEFIKRGVESMAAVSILPKPAVKTELEARTLKSLPVEGLDLARRLCVIHHRRRELSAGVKCFIEVLLEEENQHEPQA